MQVLFGDRGVQTNTQNTAVVQVQVQVQDHW